jgi:hypothetical protein
MSDVSDQDDQSTATGTHRHYVYTLAYSDGRVFYVGKGKGDGINAHEQEARSGVQSQKCAIIRAIWEQGGEVVKSKVAYFASDEEATRYERFLISSLDGLANVQGGTDQFSSVTIALEDQHRFGASIRRVDPDGQEYWSARGSELSGVRFVGVLQECHREGGEGAFHR